MPWHSRQNSSKYNIWYEKWEGHVKFFPLFICFYLLCLQVDSVSIEPATGQVADYCLFTTLLKRPHPQSIS